jgi:hypothetical protein
LAKFWFSADWPPYSPNLNSLDFSTGSVLQPKGQATPHANFAALCLSVAVEWDRKAAVQIRKTYRSFRRRRSVVAKKNEVKIEWWLTKGPAYTKQFFSGLI